MIVIKVTKIGPRGAGVQMCDFNRKNCGFAMWIDDSYSGEWNTYTNIFKISLEKKIEKSGVQFRPSTPQ